MLPQQRRGQPHRAIAQSVHGHRIAHLAHRPKGRVLEGLDQPQRLHLRLRECVGDVVDRSGRDTLFDHPRRPCGTVLPSERSFQQRLQLRAVLHPVRVRQEA